MNPYRYIPLTPCEHQWEWVQPRIVIIGDPLGLAPNDLDTYNARCTLCGKTTWAHGWNVPMKETSRETP